VWVEGIELINFSDGLIDELAQYNDELTANAWRIGDLLVMAVDEYKHLTKYAAPILRELASQTGGSAETYRDRERVCRKIPPKARAKYPLSFHQFRACLAAGDNWQFYAEWAMEYADDHNGRPASVDAIRAQVSGNDDEDPTWMKQFMKIQEKAEVVLCNPETPAHVRDALDKLIRIDPHPPRP
jgi:hypothetical protein